jgi:hypothetical protein
VCSAQTWHCAALTQHKQYNKTQFSKYGTSRTIKYLAAIRKQKKKKERENKKKPLKGLFYTFNYKIAGEQRQKCLPL